MSIEWFNLYEEYKDGLKQMMIKVNTTHKTEKNCLYLI